MPIVVLVAGAITPPPKRMLIFKVLQATRIGLINKRAIMLSMKIQDSRARNEDLEDRILSSVKKQENSIKSLETQVTELESEQKNNKSSSGGWLLLLA